jgi:hypothetical protein
MFTTFLAEFSLIAIVKRTQIHYKIELEKSTCNDLGMLPSKNWSKKLSTVQVEPSGLQQMAKRNMPDRAIHAVKAKPIAKPKPPANAKPAKAKPSINSKRAGEVVMAA